MGDGGLMEEGTGIGGQEVPAESKDWKQGCVGDD